MRERGETMLWVAEVPATASVVRQTFTKPRATQTMKRRRYGRRQSGGETPVRGGRLNGLRWYPTSVRSRRSPQAGTELQRRPGG